MLVEMIRGPDSEFAEQAYVERISDLASSNSFL